METTIFYFSATGNSLNLSRAVSDRLGNCEVIPMARFLDNDSILVTSSKVGFIFPVFAWGMPRIVEEFVSRLNFSEKPYVFAIATCVAIQGNTLKDLRRVLRAKQVDLNAGFAVKAGRSSLMRLNALDRIIIRLDRQRLRIQSAEERMADMVEVVRSRTSHSPETSSWSANLFGSLLHNLAIKNFKCMDMEFMVSDSCTACGNCVNICPRLNIEIKDGYPVFHHNCELCHACIQWCPNFAIRHPNFDDKLTQYRNNNVKLIDMLAAR